MAETVLWNALNPENALAQARAHDAKKRAAQMMIQQVPTQAANEMPTSAVKSGPSILPRQ